MKIEINTTGLSTLELENTSVFSRYAVRSVAIKDNTILTIYSSTNGDYSLPGGGVELGESYQDALKREVKEETGYEVIRIKELYVELKEIHRSKFREDNAEYFENNSYYYLVDVSEERGEQMLTESEIREGLEVRWEKIDFIIKNNHELMNTNQYPRWVIRETKVFEYIKDSIIDNLVSRSD